MGLKENIGRDAVSELDMRPLIAVKASDKVRHAVSLMKKNHLGCVIAVDDAGRPVGKFTERRLMKALSESPTALDDTVSRWMYKNVDCVRTTDSILRMVELMEERGLRFICVVDEQGKAVALTGQKGLMQYMAEHFPRQIKAQRMKSIVSMDQREGA